ncbi:hypothetical protein CNYM01_01691 [Colletotrichum nymphaeae SA-01]|uniref:Azaphilone pigments biosynthesis cluster protein L N-terminal domain-containing protein n=1 Tax=Colletotrichum nymphaeae SA-01 TaxID=1460502 RepID=A0A135TWV2_9PEZI|nr:hypothetical protein CNYM01_01691 [Colletotrichum nymphaeae SA-01]
MADPLSITTACITLIGAIGKTTQAVTNFVRTCRDAREDLAAVSRELSDLRIVLELLIDDTATKASLPAAFEKHVLALVGNCLGVTTEIAGELGNHDGRTGPARWAMGGKETVNQLKTMLEMHKGSLNLALELANLVSSKAIKDDTVVIRNDAGLIKEDTTNLLRQVSDVTLQIARIRKAVGANGQIKVANSDTIDLWLESLTSYAESVCGDLLQDLPPNANDRMLLPETELVGSGIVIHNDTIGDIEPMKVTRIRQLTYSNSIHYIRSKGSHLISVDGVSNVIIWDIQTGKQLGTLDTKKSHSWDIYKVKTASICGHDSEYIILHQHKVGGSLWDWKKGKRVLDVYQTYQDWITLHPVHLDGKRLVVFWHDKHSIWKSEKPKWKHEKLAEIPGPAEISRIGIWGNVAVALLKDGNAICLETLTGSVKAKNSILRLGQEDKCDNLAIGLILIRQPDGGHRVLFWIPDVPNGSVMVIAWDIEKDRVIHSEYGGYVKQEHEQGKPKGFWPTAFFDRGALMTHGEGIDFFNFATGSRRRYHNPFPHKQELEVEKEVWYGLFGRKHLKVPINLGRQATVSQFEGKYRIAVRAPGGGVEVWEWELDEISLEQQRGQTDTTTRSIGSSTLTAGS